MILVNTCTSLHHSPASLISLDGYDDADLALALAGTGLDSMPEADAYDFYETYMDEEEVRMTHHFLSLP